LEMLLPGSSTVFWTTLGQISNIASSVKRHVGGRLADYVTASQAYGRKILKFLYHLRHNYHGGNSDPTEI
jgi:hypothetical protein